MFQGVCRQLIAFEFAPKYIDVLLETSDALLQHVVRILMLLKLLLHRLHLRKSLRHRGQVEPVRVLGLLARQDLIVVLAEVAQCLVDQTLRGIFVGLVFQ